MTAAYRRCARQTALLALGRSPCPAAGTAPGGVAPRTWNGDANALAEAFELVRQLTARFGTSGMLRGPGGSASLTGRAPQD